MIPKQVLRKMTDKDIETKISKLYLAIKHAMGSLYPNIWGGEIGQLRKELERRNPKTINYTVEADMMGCGAIFYHDLPNEKWHRVHPRKPSGGTRYPQDLTADEIEAWMRNNGFTHVFANTEDNQTSPECIKRGRHTRAAFIKWWRLLEED